MLIFNIRSLIGKPIVKDSTDLIIQRNESLTALLVFDRRICVRTVLYFQRHLLWIIVSHVQRANRSATK
jgi:hypothetical protein